MCGCGELRRLDRPPRGAALDGARVYVSDQGHFSVARALDELGFPAETLVIAAQRRPLPAPRRRPRGASRRRPGAAADAVRGRGGDGHDQHRVHRRRAGHRRRSPRAERLWLHVDAAYGGAARLSNELAPLVPGLELGRLGHRRSPQVVLPGVRHRRPDGPRRSTCWSRRSRVAPSTTAVAATRPASMTPTTATRSTSIDSASRAPVAGGRSSCG